MKIQLITDDEPAVRVPIGESALYVRRLSQKRDREILAARRREFRQGLAAGDPEAVAAFNAAVEDDRLDQAVVKWEDLDGDPPCTRENKLALPLDAQDVVRAIARSVSRVRGDDEGAAKKGSGK